MPLDAIQKKYIPRENSFYRNHYHHVIMSLMLIIVLMMCAVGFVLYQTLNQPLPAFHAVQANGEKMTLTPYQEPNLLPDTLLRWASKAAVAAYTFDFYNYEAQVQLVRPYFTDSGWRDYLQSANTLFETIVQNQIIVNGTVSGTPVIGNQGPLPGFGYAWRVQIPFLVTYQSANGPYQQNFLVALTIVRVPTNINPQGIGIDQFVMLPR